MAEPEDIEEVPERPGLWGRIAEAAAARSGRTVLANDEYELMEAQVEDRRMLRKELDLIAYTALDYAGGNEQDMQVVARRRLVQQARVAWQQDPQLGAATDLMNDFVLGRGVPKPKARDPKVQEAIDEAWEDEDNQLVLTSYAAQMAIGTDLSLQSNLFFLIFDSGDDGKVKLAMLEHDGVENVVRDPDNRRRILYYVSRRKQIKWDYQNDQAKALTEPIDRGQRIRYYAHWRNKPGEGQAAPSEKLGKGRVYHVAINRGSEMAFGHPTAHRVLRWANAFNSLMESRVDAAKAAAAFMMKRKVKGTPTQVQKMATKVLSRSGELGRAYDPNDGSLVGPRGGSTITENEGVEHETFKLDSGAQGANVDGQMIRSQISAGTHFPQHYLGDIGSANLATATSMELPVLKAVESRQEVFEQLFRWFVDRVIERAQDAGKLTEYLTDEEWAEKQAEQEKEGTEDAPPKPSATPENDGGAPNAAQNGQPALAEAEEQPEPDLDLGDPAPVEDEHDEDEDEEMPEERLRDMSYDFSLPSPVRRMMTDLTNSISMVARTFDPNGTNIELSRTLLAIALGEGLEMTDPAEIVDKVYPPGYKDPAMAALEAQQNPPPGAPGGQEPPPGIVLQPNPAGGEENPYGAPMNGSTPENNPYGLTEARWQSRESALAALEETFAARLASEQARERVRRRTEQAGEDFDAATESIRHLTGGTP